MGIKRSHLFHVDSTMNQLRNAIYHLARILKNDEKREINVNEKLRDMGRNIARTFVNYWKPIDIVNKTNLKDVLKTIYRTILGSSISIEVNNNEKLILVKDYKCPLCRYPYSDLSIAGCEILLGMVSEFINLINKDSSETSTVFLDPFEVKASQALGDDLCLQVFKYKVGGG